MKGGRTGAVGHGRKHRRWRGWRTDDGKQHPVTRKIEGGPEVTMTAAERLEVLRVQLRESLAELKQDFTPEFWESLSDHQLRVLRDEILRLRAAAIDLMARIEGMRDGD